ncbi:uncharacterized protein LOC110459891 [Mizuhopecten yessoensis]|uniref:Cyclic GMP-AMP synthase n=1 Tax=Mizuhopecten yessoensis TaxID=6573 RepID=A0A210Q3C1_MIZYE|nr:uncharacterized protein LOC110459891 [Mizuhopecten yessoensis]OWF43237.1 Cyclic GMP-AMP synthase [Mizuhopecten yessoensis]
MYLSSFSEVLIMLPEYIPKKVMLDSRESERISMLLSTHLERKFTGTKEEVDIRRRVTVLGEYLDQMEVTCGSHGEGFRLRGSDIDGMLADMTVAVIYPNQFISRNMASKTILYIREADCRPGYVHLQFGQMGQGCRKRLFDSLVRVGNSTFLSSGMYRELAVNFFSDYAGKTLESNGPSCTVNSHGYTSMDIVWSLFCYSWPKEANEWRTRTRLYGWPCQTLIDNIVDSGFFLVPVGDKCSENTFLQWRISFAKAERSLVHSFTHIQFKVYALLKYFLTQIKGTLADTIGDDDILCSYFLKIVMFHAIENTSHKFWQEKNLFYCFWFCFNILIAWVRAGYCPNYFIPTNNLFKRKVHGQHQQILLDVLNNFYQMKWMCLSVGNHFDPIWWHLCNISNQAELLRPKTEQDIVFQQDINIIDSLRFNSGIANRTTLRKALKVLSTSKSDLDEFFTYHHITEYLYKIASDQIYPDHVIATDNKTRYRSLRKCKHWMIPRASMGTELLYLATCHFLLGTFSKALDMCKQMTKLASYFTLSYPNLHTFGYCQSGQVLGRLQQIFTAELFFHDQGIYLPHICLEMKRPTEYPPLPYAVFLSFLCCHELGDARGRDAALRQLTEVQCDTIQGGHRYWIVHTFLGICYQMLGDNHRAIRAYWDSAQSKAIFQGKNPAMKRIAIVYLCMYASHRSDRG